MTHQFKLLHRLAGFAFILALLVTVLGSWVRLSDAGLGCPDWPGCYGHITWPTAENEIASADAQYPNRPVEVDKAAKEVIHRYFAGTLGVIIFILAWLNWRLRDRYPETPYRLALALVPIVIAQALFGMWTVTLKLLPWVVTTHLCGGMLTVSLLFWLRRRIGLVREKVAEPAPEFNYPAVTRWRRLAIISVAVLAIQIALGGWVSSNYAALACTDFPTCQQQWWPATNFTEGFTIWREIGVDYEGGVLDQEARNAIHVTHRIGALITSIVLASFAVALMCSYGTRRTGLLILLYLSLQVILGINNVLLKLPLWNAVAHNGVAALLLIAVINGLWRTRYIRIQVK